MKTKVIVLLSSKSSGSSALQKYLTSSFGVKVLPKVSHHENETLFWTKAASVLGLFQNRMHRSVVPYSQDAASRLLLKLINDNCNERVSPPLSEIKVFNSFKNLVSDNGPFFFEKSPHHLFNFSNIELILKCKEYLKDDVDFYIIGLVRNPLDTIYSAWDRWRYNCTAFEEEWFQSYKNLENLKSKIPELVVLQYESIVMNTTMIDKFCSEAGLNKSSDKFKFNQRSLNKWQKNNSFKHKLKPKTIDLATRFGYKAENLNTRGSGGLLWKQKEFLGDAFFLLKRLKRRLL